MKKLTTFMISSVLLLGTAACDGARTSADAPTSTDNSTEVMEADEARASKEDATSETRRNQLNADIRAREERNNALNDGAAVGRDDDNLESEVRSKLEANLPASKLVVEAEDGNVVISGNVPTQAQYERIEPLAKEIKGVFGVDLKVTVAPAKPEGS